jgi:DNA-binding MarR family transcriptional regulator/N-acetylglutamate synthase-like GNAT family acetyltransferase
MVSDVIAERGELFLGSRFKRLAERMQGDVIKVVEAAGLPIQPSQYPVLATLDRDGPQTIGALTKAIQFSQPTITRAISRLVELGLVEVSRRHRDQRHKTVALTAEGAEAVARSKALIWPQVEKAVAELTADLDGPLLAQITTLEARLAERPLDRRAREAAGAGLRVLEFSDELAAAFREINTEWIKDMYSLEAADREVLDHPRERIIAPGGDILFVEADGLGVVGACALQKTGEGRFELTKMGVRAKARGRGAGEVLLRAVIARAQALGAEVLYLLSNEKSAVAIRLYERLGFRHDAEIMQEYGARYQRCNVAMRYAPPAQ